MQSESNYLDDLCKSHLGLDDDDSLKDLDAYYGGVADEDAYYGSTGDYKNEQ